MPEDCEVVLLLGGNLGNREQYLGEARRKIEAAIGPITKKSAIYETEAWGVKNQQPYLNQVLCVKTSISAEELLQTTQKIEADLGRTRHTRWETRVIDIDTLFYGSQVIHSETIQIPHPRLHLRRFTLVPLAEIAPDLVHPELMQTVSELLKNCPDELPVTRYAN